MGMLFSMARCVVWGAGTALHLQIVANNVVGVGEALNVVADNKHVRDNVHGAQVAW